jgi:hypothetical protein
MENQPVILLMKLARGEYPVAGRTFADQPSTPIYDGEFFFMPEGFTCSGDAISELAIPSTKAGVRLITRHTFGQSSGLDHAGFRIIGVEPAMVRGDAILFCRPASPKEFTWSVRAAECRDVTQHVIDFLKQNCFGK